MIHFRPRPQSNLSPADSSESSDSPGSHSTISQSTASEKSVTPHKTPDILPSLSPVLVGLYGLYKFLLAFLAQERIYKKRSQKGTSEK